MKILLTVCDGMGDRPVNGLTPLEAADTPNMDILARGGINGIMDTVRIGVRPGSDTSHLSIFGYDPFSVYTGRGPFEAYGAGIELEKGDVALRANFASIEKGKITDRRAGRDEEGLDVLAKAIDKLRIDDVQAIFKRGKGHRAVIVLRGTGLSSNISSTDPEQLGAAPLKSGPLDNDGKSRKASDALNKFTKISNEILATHDINNNRISQNKPPANIILARGAGIPPSIPSFEEKYGLNAASVSGTTMIKGISRALGMDVLEVGSANGHIDSDIGKKAAVAIDSLKNYDFVFLHIKGTDEASHDLDFDKKKAMLERIDEEVIGPIINTVDIDNTTIALTADHSTPVAIGQHTADPVPIVIAGDVRCDSVERFTERECARGGLNRICGINLMDVLLDLCNRSNIFGA